MEISVYEYERAYLDYKLTYSQDWSASAKRGTPVLTADVTRVYFYVKATEAGAAYITLTDASASQIEWLSPTTGQIRVKLGTNTGGHAADSQFFELRIKLADGSYVTADKGKISIKESLVDNP